MSTQLNALWKCAGSETSKRMDKARRKIEHDAWIESIEKHSLETIGIESIPSGTIVQISDRHFDNAWQRNLDPHTYISQAGWEHKVMDSEGEDKVVRFAIPVAIANAKLRAYNDEWEAFRKS